MGRHRKGSEIRHPTSSRPRESRSAQVSVRRAVEKTITKEEGFIKQSFRCFIADGNVNALPQVITQSAQMLVIDRVITLLVKFGYQEYEFGNFI